MAQLLETTVREGFICPICMQDFANVNLLQDHFTATHSHVPESDNQNNLKALLNRAKRKIMQDDSPGFIVGTNSSDSGASGSYTERSFAFYDNPYESQPFGHSRMLTNEFRKYRKSQMTRSSIEMNKLIIRLEKLTADDAPPDAGKRKAFEQHIVPWVEDNLVHNCPSCGVKFGVNLSLQSGDLLRRRHHCRLCGYMICSNCSHFLPVGQALRLLQLVHWRHKGDQLEGELDNHVAQEIDHGGEDDEGEEEVGQLGFIRRSGSLNSLIGNTVDHTKEYEFRCCEICRNTLELKFKQIEEKRTTPFSVKLYEKLRTEMDKIDQMLPEYERMANSIFAGQTTYSLVTVNDYRNEVKTLFERVAMLGKRIEELGREGNTPREILLLSSVNAYARRFLVDKMAPLRSLPRPDQYEELVLQRMEKLRLEHEADERKQRAQMARGQSASPSHRIRASTTNSQVPGKPTADSWIPSQQRPTSPNPPVPPSPTSCSDIYTKDPVLETLALQLSNVRGYLDQARTAKRKDEVVTLERNVVELKAEYASRKAALRLHLSQS